MSEAFTRVRPEDRRRDARTRRPRSTTPFMPVGPSPTEDEP